MKVRIIRVLSIGIMLMGLVHIVATFTPLIASKLAILPDSAQGAFTYLSLMCGALLVLGGVVTFTLSGRVTEYAFVRVPYALTLATLFIDGMLAAYYMPLNPFAWIIFALVIGLILANVKKFQA